MIRHSPLLSDTLWVAVNATPKSTLLVSSGLGEQGEQAVSDSGQHTQAQSGTDFKQHTSRCVICFDFFNEDEGLKCRAARAHFVCKADLEAYIKMWTAEHVENANRTFDERRLRLSCPGCRASDATRFDLASTFAGSDLAEHVPADTLDAFRAAVHLLSQRAAADRARVRVERRAAAADWGGRRLRRMLHDVLAKQLRRLMKRPVQCGACGFGPVDHFACTDLTTHHRELREPDAGGGGAAAAAVDNSCPRCGWFSSSVDEWPRWNGALPAELAACCPNRPVRPGEDGQDDGYTDYYAQVPPTRLAPPPTPPSSHPPPSVA